MPIISNLKKYIKIQQQKKTHIANKKMYPQLPQIKGDTTYSQKRAKQLTQQSDNIAAIFNINNFYDNNHLNVIKLKQKIIQAKRKLLFDKDKDKEYKNGFRDINNRTFNNTNIRQDRSREYDSHKQRQQVVSQKKQAKKVKIFQNKNIGLLQTQQQIDQYKNIILGLPGRSNKKTIQSQHRSQYKSKSYKLQSNNQRKIPRLATDLGDYKLNRKDSFTSYSRMTVINQASNNFKNRGKLMKKENTEAPIQNSRSIMQFQIEHKKIVIGDSEQFKQYESKIIVLWQLYEIIVQIMQQVSRSQHLNQKLVLSYIKQVNSQKFQFIHQISQLFSQTRFQRTIRLSRILQNFSIFQTSLNSIPKKKGNPSQIINYLGYSSSSVIFLIKILLLSHQSSYTFTQKIKTIIESMIKFQINSYKMQLKNIKQVLRRLQHNNQIIGMIKNRSGKKHGKYCQQFISKMIKNIQRYKTPFYQCSNNIFEFLAFYLHYQQLAGNLVLLSTPPHPFLSLAYSKTIIIDPWCVLANRKNNKLVIRAHTGKFLAEISDSCNIIFWTQFMPKDAEILTNLFPVKDNIYWLYRYHCRQENQVYVKMVNFVGCALDNTIIIDSVPEHYKYNQDIGISMFWKGQKKDTKLLNLSDMIQFIFAQSNKNKTTLKVQVGKMRNQLDQLSSLKKNYTHKAIKYKSK